MSTAEKFKALGAGNGLTFCKAKTPTETRNQPLSVLTLKECMAWYWLLEDIDLTLTLQNDYNGDDYVSSLHLQFDVISGHDEELGDDGKRFYDGVPKDRAALHPEERHEMADGQFHNHTHEEELPTPQAGGVGPVNSFLPGGESSFIFDIHMVVEWFDNDTASVTILVDDGYHRFVLTNLPTTSDLFTTVGGGFNSGMNRLDFNPHTNGAITPIQIGTISTAYGDLTAYDISLNGTYSGYQVTAVAGTIQFYDFGS